MSIYNAIANAGSEVGAGLNAFARSRYAIVRDREQNALAAEDRQYQRSRNALADQRYEQQRRDQVDQRTQQYVMQGLEQASRLPSEQREQFLRGWQRQGMQLGIKGVASPINMQELSPFLDAMAARHQGEGFTLGQGQTRYDARGDVIASNVPIQSPMTPRERADLRKAEAQAKQAEMKVAEAEAQQKAKEQTAQQVKDLALSLLEVDAQGNVVGLADGVSRVYGALDQFFFSVGDAATAEAKIDQLVSLLTLENTDKMTGVLSESDIKILRDAGTILGMKGVPEEAVLAELSKVAGVFNRNPEALEAAAEGTLQRDASGRVTGNTMNIGGATLRFTE